MRFLFSTWPANGHLQPAFRLAQGLKTQGHDVLIATASGAKGMVEKQGFQHLQAGLEWSQSRLTQVFPELTEIPEAKRERWLWQDIYMGRVPQQMIPDLLNLIQTWKPDVLVNDVFEIGGPIVAETLGIPYASYHPTLFYWSRDIIKQQMGAQIEHFRQEQGLPSDPNLMAYGRYLDICFSPDQKWTQLTKTARPKTVHSLRLLDQMTDLEPPTWLAELDDRPQVLMSLGSVLGAQYPELFKMVIEALIDEEINLIITVGSSGFDVKELGQLPENVRIEPFIAHQELLGLLQKIDVFINHGGFNSTVEGLMAGVPLLILPFCSDQPITYKLCTERQVAIPLPPEVLEPKRHGSAVVVPHKLTSEIFRTLVCEILDNQCYTRSAREVQQEFTLLPEVDSAVELLEQLII